MKYLPPGFNTKALEESVKSKWRSQGSRGPPAIEIQKKEYACWYESDNAENSSCWQKNFYHIITLVSSVI